MTRRSDYAEAVLGELDRAGVKYEITNGSSHKMVEWVSPTGRRRKMQCDMTASDHRSAENARHDVIRALREDGLLPEVDERPRLTLVDGRAFASSLDVADRFGKAHKDVLRAYDQVATDAGAYFTERNFALSSYKDASGRSLRCVEMTRDGFSLLAMGFTGAAAVQWKIKYLAAFAAMESQMSGVAELKDRVERLEGDLRAATDLLMEIPAPAPAIQRTIIVRKAPFVRPSVLRKQRYALRGVA